MTAFAQEGTFRPCFATSADYSLLPAKAKENYNVKVRVAIMETIMIL